MIVERKDKLVLKFSQVARALDIVCQLDDFLLGRVLHKADTHISEGADQVGEHVLGLRLKRNRIKVNAAVVLLANLTLNVYFEFEFVLFVQEFVAHDSDAFFVFLPHVLVVLDVTVQTKHVEVNSNTHDMVLLLQEQVSFKALPFGLVLEEVRLTLDKHDCILVLALLLENLNVEHDELFVDLEALLLHQLEHEQVGDVEHFSLEFQVQTDKVHRFDCPLCMQWPLMLLVKRQGLVLLLEQVSLSDVRKEQQFIRLLFAWELSSDFLKHSCSLVVLTQRIVYQTQVLGSLRVLRLLTFEFRQDVQALLLLFHLEGAICRDDRIEDGLAIVFVASTGA